MSFSQNYSSFLPWNIEDSKCHFSTKKSATAFKAENRLFNTHFGSLGTLTPHSLIKELFLKKPKTLSTRSLKMILYFFTGRYSRSQRANSCNISSPDQCQSLDHMLAPTCDLGREAKEPLQRKMCRPSSLSNLSKYVPPLCPPSIKKSNISLRRRADEIGKLLVSIDDHNRRH